VLTNIVLSEQKRSLQPQPKLERKRGMMKFRTIFGERSPRSTSPTAYYCLATTQKSVGVNVRILVNSITLGEYGLSKFISPIF